jgi:hypothetical protein
VVTLEHVNAATHQHTLGKARDETQQQYVERIAVHVGKGKVFRFVIVANHANSPVFYVLQTEFYAMTKANCGFYALQTDFWANEKRLRRIMVTFAQEIYSIVQQPTPTSQNWVITLANNL